MDPTVFLNSVPDHENNKSCFIYPKKITNRKFPSVIGKLWNEENNYEEFNVVARNNDNEFAIALDTFMTLFIIRPVMHQWCCINQTFTRKKSRFIGTGTVLM